MQERKQHVKLGKERNEKQFLLACFPSEGTDLSVFWGRDRARTGSGCQRGRQGVRAARGGNPVGMGTGLLLPGE